MEKAKAESLVKWINQLGGSTPCSCLEELASGEILLERMQKIIPELQGSCARNPWDCLLQVLEEFCDCVPSKFLQIQSLSQGDVEQIGRAVVIFLCMAVQKKPNEDIIAGITSLDPFAQRDIMFFIENTLGKMETHALMTGEFTSGIGDSLPPLEEPSNPPEGPNMPEPQPDLQKVIPAPPSTPSRFTKRCAYDGLASPAAARWLLTPVMSKKGRPITDTNIVPANEEVPMLRHKIRVLEKRLETESKMARDFHTDLCQLSKEHEYLKAKCNEAEGKLKQLRNMQDLEDELEESRQKLSKAEKSLGRLQDEMEALGTFRKRCSELEKRVLELEPAQTKLEECQMRVEHLNTMLGEQRAQMKQQQLHFGTLEVQLKVKNEQLESSIQQVAKLTEEFKDLHLAQRLVKEREVNLEREKEELQEKLQTTTARFHEEKLEMTVKMDELKAQVEHQYDELKSALATIETVKAQLEANERQLSVSEEQMANMCSQHEREACQLQGEFQQVKLQYKKMTEEAQRVTTVILGDKETANVVDENGSGVIYNLKRVESLWPKKLQELSSLQEQCVMVQGSLNEANGTVAKLEAELKDSRHDNSMLKESLCKAQQETRRVQADLQRVAKGFADLKVSNSLLEVQLDQSRDAEEQTLKKKACVEESLFQATESNCLIQRELNDWKEKHFALETTLKEALEQKSALQNQVTMVSKQLATCEEELACTQKNGKEQSEALHEELVSIQESNVRLQMELKLSVEKSAKLKNELLKSQDDLAKAMLEHQVKSSQLQIEWGEQKLHLISEHESKIKLLEAEQQQRREQLQAAHSTTIEQLKANYEAKTEWLQSEQEKRINELQRRHDASIEQLLNQHTELVELLKCEHETKLEELKCEKGRAVEALQAEHKVQMEHLQTEHEKVMEKLKTEHESVHEQLRLEQKRLSEQLRCEEETKLEQLKSEHEKVTEQLKSEHKDVIGQLKLEHGQKVEQLKSEQEKMIEQLQTELVLAYEATKSLEEEVNRKLQEAYGNVVATQFELTQTHKQLEQSRDEVALLTRQHKESSEKLLVQLHESEEALQSKVKDVVTLGDQLQAAANEKKNVEERLQSTMQQLVSAEEELSRTQTQSVELSRKHQQLEAEVIRLERENKEDAERFQCKLNDAQESLVLAKSEAEELKRTLQHSNEQKSKIEQEHSAVTQELNLQLIEARNQVEELIHQKDSAEYSQKQLLQKTSELEEEIKKLHTAHKSLIEAKEVELSSMQCKWMKRLEDAQRETISKEEHLSQLHQELLSVSEQKKEAEHETCRLNMVLEAARLEVVDVKNTFKQMVEEKEALKVQLSRAEQWEVCCKKVQEEAVYLQGALKSEAEKRVDLEMEVANAQHQVAKNNQTMAEMNFRLRTIQDENIRHQEQYTALEFQLKQTTEQLTNEKSLYNDTTSKLQVEISKCKAELAALNEKFAEQSGLHQRQCDELEKEKCTLLKRNDELQEELQHIHEMKHDSDRMCAEYKDDYTKESQKVQELSELNEVYLRESQQLLQYREAYSQESQRVQELLQFKEAYSRELGNVQQLSKQMAAIQDERDEQVMDLNASLAKEQKQTNKLAAEVKSLRAQLAYAEQRLRDNERGRNHVLLSANPSLYSQHPAKSDSIANNQCMTEERFEGNISGHFHAAMQEDQSAAVSDDVFPVSRRQTLQPATQPMASTGTVFSRTSSVLPTIPEEDSAERIKELQRRNTRTLPHLKSSYPVELQTQSPSISDERIKAGTQPTSRFRSRPQSMQFDIPNDGSVLKSNVSKDKNDPGVESPVTSRKRPSIQQTPSIPSPEELGHPLGRRLTMVSSGMKLRDFLDEKENIKRPEVIKEPIGAGTSFEISFLSEGTQKPIQLPKRLAQRQEARAHEKKPNQTSSSSTAVGALKKVAPKPQPTRAQKALISSN